MPKDNVNRKFVIKPSVRSIAFQRYYFIDGGFSRTNQSPYPRQTPAVKCQTQRDLIEEKNHVQDKPLLPSQAPSQVQQRRHQGPLRHLQRQQPKMHLQMEQRQVWQIPQRSAIMCVSHSICLVRISKSMNLLNVLAIEFRDEFIETVGINLSTD